MRCWVWTKNVHTLWHTASAYFENIYSDQLDPTNADFPRNWQRWLSSLIISSSWPSVGNLDARPSILIFITCPLITSAGPDFASKSSGFLVQQTIVCHMPSGKFRHFLVKFMKAAVCLSPPSNLYDPILLWWIACLMGTDRWGWK